MPYFALTIALLVFFSVLIMLQLKRTARGTRIDWVTSKVRCKFNAFPYFVPCSALTRTLRRYNRLPRHCVWLWSTAMVRDTARRRCRYCAIPCNLCVGIFGRLRAQKMHAAIGVDDMFVMASGWHATSRSWSVDDRIAHTMSDTAVAITITSLTSALGFAIGCITTVPAAQLFCTFAALSIIFNYFMQVCKSF